VTTNNGKGSSYKFGDAEQANLGSVRAESDRAMLNSAFVRTSDFESLARGPLQSFVVGRRGAGKSALFLQLGIHFRKAPDAVVLELRPDESDTRALYAAIRRVVGTTASYRQVKSVMRHVWQAVLLEHSIQMVQQHHRDVRLRERATMHVVPAWRTDTPFGSAEALLDAIPDRLSVDEFISSLTRATRLSDLRDQARQLLFESGSRAIVLVDRLDEGWARETVENGVVGGLAAAAIDLRERSTGISPILFIRDNMYRVLEEEDDDFSRNIAGDTIRLHWTADGLFTLVTARLRVFLEANSEIRSDEIWNRFAKRELHGRAGFARCLQHTLYRPRDILELLNSAVQLSKRAGRNEIVPDDVIQSALDISRSRLNDLRKEYESAIPGITGLLNIFSNQPPIVSVESAVALIKRCTDNGFDGETRTTAAYLGSPVSIFHALHDVGFIGIEKPDGGFAFCHDGTTTANGDLAPTRRVAVHPCYAKALNISEPAEQDLEIWNAVTDEYDEGPSGAAQLRQRVLAGVESHWGRLATIEEGAAGANAYMEWVRRSLEILFAGSLNDLTSHPNGASVSRRDITADNQAKDGLWRHLKDVYSAHSVFFETKNYEPLTSGDYQQAIKYASNEYGGLAFIVYRTNREQLSANERSHVQDAWGENRVLMVLVSSERLAKSLRKHFHDAKEAQTYFRRWVKKHEQQFRSATAGRHAQLIGE
jgi:hypothetical protein